MNAGFCTDYAGRVSVLEHMGPGLAISLSLSQIGSRSSLDNRTKPALQPQDDIPISVLLYIAQQRVIIVAISEGENYILGQI